MFPYSIRHSFFQTEAGGTILFALVLLVFFTVCGLPEILCSQPSGFHFIRQTDSLSFASTYFKEGHSFFQPHVWNLSSENGRAACEFPLLYAISAGLYKITGDNPSVLRSLVWLIFFAGSLSAFLFIRRAAGRNALAILFTIPPLASTVIWYFSSVPMVDSAALGFTLIGIERLFYWYNNERKTRELIWAFLFFTLAALLKITFAIWPIAAAIAIFIAGYKRNQGSTGKRTFAPAIASVIMLAITGTWYLYAMRYNQLSGDNYFLTAPRSWLSLNANDRSEVIIAITQRWKQAWYPNEMWIALIACLIAGVINARRLPRVLVWTTIIGLVGVSLYVFLFFGQFRDHDYYFLPIAPLALILFSLAAHMVATLKIKALQLTMVGLTAALSISSLHYSGTKWKRRYAVSESYYSSAPLSLYQSLKTTCFEVDSGAHVLVLGDATRNGSLYFLGTPGITARDATDFIRHQNSNTFTPDLVFYPDFLEQALDSLPYIFDHAQEIGTWRVRKTLSVK